jgi:hypothetical protein
MAVNGRLARLRLRFGDPTGVGDHCTSIDIERPLLARGGHWPNTRVRQVPKGRSDIVSRHGENSIVRRTAALTAVTCNPAKVTVTCKADIVQISITRGVIEEMTGKITRAVQQTPSLHAMDLLAKEPRF